MCVKRTLRVARICNTALLARGRPGIDGCPRGTESAAPPDRAASQRAATAGIKIDSYIFQSFLLFALLYCGGLQYLPYVVMNHFYPENFPVSNESFLPRRFPFLFCGLHPRPAIYFKSLIYKAVVIIKPFLHAYEGAQIAFASSVDLEGFWEDGFKKVSSKHNSLSHRSDVLYNV